jgi:1,2-dihydroxy-3-keto-5-methylthiopentene dioxygenase
MKAQWLETGEIVSSQDLKENGIAHEKIELEYYQAHLDRIKFTYGYVAQDVVEITPQTANLEAILAKFDKEHLHTDDEVRFVLAGYGVFDIRSKDDRWMRVEVTEGDFISVPKDRYHRFFCGENPFIRCVRLFKDHNGWTPLYRPGLEAATA